MWHPSNCFEWVFQWWWWLFSFNILWHNTCSKFRFLTWRKVAVLVQVSNPKKGSRSHYSCYCPTPLIYIKRSLILSSILIFLIIFYLMSFLLIIGITFNIFSKLKSILNLDYVTMVNDGWWCLIYPTLLSYLCPSSILSKFRPSPWSINLLLVSN